MIKALILFLGPTGSGKSTTINYLLGAPFIRKSKDEVISNLNTKIN